VLLRRRSWPTLALAALVLASALWRIPYLRDCLHDDAFISMRYARHLAAGSGLTFNAGERVEGFTNFLWTVVLAAAMRLGADPVRLAPLLSLAPALLLIVWVYRCGQRYGGVPHAGWALVAPVIVAAHPFLLAESVGGLETTCFVLLAFIGFERQLAERAGEARGGSSAAAFALATLMRPEGAMLFVVAWLGDLIATGGADWRTRARRDLLTYVLLVAPLVVFRRVYYQDWVPNTFHAKVGWNWAQVARGLRYVRESGGAVAPIPVICLGLAGLRGGGWRWTAALLASVYLLYVLAVGGDFAPTGRFALLPIPFVALLVQSAVVRFAAHVPRARWRMAAALAAALVATGWSCATAAHWLRARRWPASSRQDLAARTELGR
jgi:arabinofuranosyltransferase